MWSNSNGAHFGGQKEVRYCDIEDPGFTGLNGNISSDPRFLNPSEGYYQILPDSPCIDAGSNAAPLLPDLDIEREPRIMDVYDNLTTDMGADEHNPETLHVLAEELAAVEYGTVTVSYSLWNAESRACSVVVEYSVDSSDWKRGARASGTEGTTGLTSSIASLRNCGRLCR